jgi:hypothetical protein
MNVRKLIPAQNDALFSQGSRSLSVNPLERKCKASRVWTPEFHHVNHLVLKEGDTTAVVMYCSFTRVIFGLSLLLQCLVICGVWNKINQTESNDQLISNDHNSNVIEKRINQRANQHHINSKITKEKFHLPPQGTHLQVLDLQWQGTFYPEKKCHKNISCQIEPSLPKHFTWLALLILIIREQVL